MKEQMEEATENLVTNLDQEKVASSDKKNC